MKYFYTVRTIQFEPVVANLKSNMSRFWAAASSSEGEQGSDDSDSYAEQPTQRQADRKFGSTFDESDSGMQQTN